MTSEQNKMTSEKCYPNYDEKVWQRSCEDEITVPLEGQITGELPSWLRGTLVRNGPGSSKVGSMKFNHIFDCAALLHRFAIYDGSVTYQCRFLQSNTFKRNRAANRIVVTEFGTKAVPDPCHTIFDRVSSIFKPDEFLTDNSVVSVYPFGDEMYAMTEVPIIHKIDSVTLDTLERKSLINSVVVSHTAHPHVEPNGDVYNLGNCVNGGRIKHVIVKFPFVEKGDMFEKAEIVGTMSPRWPLNPSYMHSFGITENYFVIVEQPMAISLLRYVRGQFNGDPVSSCLTFYDEYKTHIVLVSRKTGEEVKRVETETLFFVHIVNTYEKDGEVVVDICTYKDAKVLDGMYFEALENMQSNADYATWFRSKPQRIRVPLDAPTLSFCEPQTISQIGCEMPRMNYSYNGRPYRYFYGISSDVDAKFPGALIKVDVETGEIKTWREQGSYASEPVFVPTPDPKDEDDGVILSAVLFSGREHAVALLVLCARTMRELARAEFTTPSPAPKCLHGWFFPERV